MASETEPMKLREAVNVPDLKQRDALVRRLAKIRAMAVLDRDTIRHWNAAHPDQMPISTDFEEATIAWCDGKGLHPAPPPAAGGET